MGVNDKNVENLTEEELAAKAVAEADTEEDQKVYKKRQWQHKLKMGTHYRMERFTIMFFSLVSLLMIFGFTGWNTHRVAKKEEIGTKALYSDSIEFSLSGTQGVINDVYRNTDGTRAYVLIDLDDISNMSLDAENYEMYLTGFNKTLKQEPSASLILFGSSGHMALEFYDERGLSNEIYGVTLRNNSEVTTSDELTDEELEQFEDASFGTHDQAELYVNVGAEEATTMDVLDKELDPVQLYYALIGRYDEDELFEQIDEKTKELKQLLAQHNEYANRITKFGYIAPEMPEYMNGDYVDEDGNFRPRTYVQGAHQIDYIGLRTTDGFVSQVVDDVSDFRGYMADKRAAEQLAQQEGRVEEETVPSIEVVERNDGFNLDLTAGGQTEYTDEESSVSDAIATLGTTWANYLGVKRELQINLMSELLLLDANIRTQGNAYSTHSGDDFLTVW